MGITLNNRAFTKGESQLSFILPIACLFVQYAYGLGNIMLTYCILFSGYCVFKFSEFPRFKPLSVYSLWYVAILLSTVLIYGHVADRPYFMQLIRIIISGYCVTIIAKHLDKEALYRCWKVVGLIVCAVVAFQFFQIYVLHHSVQTIRLLPVSSEQLMRLDNWTESFERPVAFFTEPAMVVAFLTPVLLFAQQKQEWVVAIIVSVAILLSGSTSGVIALAIMWGTMVLSYRFSKTTRFVFVLLFIAAVFVFLNSSIFGSSLEKINYELSGESGNMNVRMLRGWMVYAVLDTRFQLLGITDYDLSAFIYQYAPEFTWQTGYEEHFYLNTAQRILIQTGVVGAILYIWMLIKLWLSTTKAVKPYLTVVIVSMFFASNFFNNGLFVLQYIVLLSYLTTFEGKSEASVKIKKGKYNVQEIHQ